MIQGTLDARTDARAKCLLSGIDQTVDHAIVLTMVMLGSKSHPSGNMILPMARDTTDSTATNQIPRAVYDRTARTSQIRDWACGSVA